MKDKIRMLLKERVPVKYGDKMKIYQETTRYVFDLHLFVNCPNCDKEVEYFREEASLYYSCGGLLECEHCKHQFSISVKIGYLFLKGNNFKRIGVRTT